MLKYAKSLNISKDEVFKHYINERNNGLTSMQAYENIMLWLLDVECDLWLAGKWN